MSLAKQLFDLQQIDLNLEAKREMIRKVQSQLGETKDLQEARDFLKQAREQLENLEKELRMAEWEIDDIQARFLAREEKLYKGSARPKELESLRKEVELLKIQKGEKEDKALEIMSQVEKQHKEVESKKSELEKVEKSWQEKQKQLLAENAETEKLLAEEEQRRGSLAVAIDSVSLQLYQALRGKKQGRAVAKVEQGRCQGCRLSLPISDLQQARTGEQLTYCSSCGRILYFAI